MSLVDEVKIMIIESLNLDDMKCDDISSDAPLFSDDGLGLDSVDALELGLAIQKKYGIVLDTKKENLKEIFHTAQSLADFIDKNKDLKK